jgi:hypothetical protein
LGVDGVRGMLYREGTRDVGGGRCLAY